MKELLVVGLDPPACFVAVAGLATPTAKKN